MPRGCSKTYRNEGEQTISYNSDVVYSQFKKPESYISSTVGHTEYMSNPNWQIVLRAIYDEGIQFDEYPDGMENDDVQRLSQVTDLPKATVREELDVLREWGLISQLSIGDANSVGLTSNGFEVAHDETQARRQYFTNEAIALFTIVLAVSSVVQTAVMVSDAPNSVIWRISGIALTDAMFLNLMVLMTAVLLVYIVRVVLTGGMFRD